ncbi:S8 family serine peptidase [Weeksellaceae bacterium KMM 9713]|uniref:S8 family serine peptidase n=1 Tax=Profundicola chukchiensis TaxID=2961959 RepID=A0A9X4RVL8_9FLAO|nr:S8 family peptidase [Profundicola chukchiensis]MDG4945900.1 S8 family serine peptidase [Profundicola chukchiensis]
MKKYVFLLGVGLMSLTYGQETNVEELKKLGDQFQIEHEANLKFISEIAAKKGWDEAQLKKHFLGKYGDYLVYIDNTDIDQIKVADVDKLYDNTISGVAVTGEGMTVYQWDGGRIDTAHTEFTDDRASNMESAESPISDHATGVAGIMVAAGVSPAAKGMAPSANVVGYDFYNNLNEIVTESANNLEYMISNHSYGYQAGWKYGEYDQSLGEGWYWFGYPSMDENESAYHGIYSTLDSYIDNIARNAPQHLMIKSAGNDRNTGPGTAVEHAVLGDNDEWEISSTFRPVNCGTTGYDCLPYGAIAKNILLVGSTNQVAGNGRYNGPSSVSPSVFTSFGPTDDGRIKPDVVTQGSSVVVPTANNGYWSQGNGTSFSSPSVTGIAVLLQQLYYELNTEYLNAAELKALIINTTNETGDYPGPDYKYGFGLVNAFNAANLIVDETNNDAIIINDVKAISEKSYALTATGDEPIRATLVWIDPAKNPGSLSFELNGRTPMLINDLDMRIIEDSSLTEYMPWTLDVENPSAAAVPGDNVLDNVEQILVPSPSAGSYTLTVNHKNGISGITQAYALVVSGAKLSTQSTNDLQAKKVGIYPNPVRDILNLSGLEGDAQVQIISANGQIVKSEKVSNKQVNVNSLPAGAYIITIKDETGATAHKFIKK